MTMLIPRHSLSIRPIAEEDTEAVLEVYRQCEDFLALGPVSTASLEMVLKDIEMSRAQAGVFCGIYAANGKMIGIVDYVPKNWEGDPSVAFLALLMIGAPFRGQGIGATVVEAVENEIRKDAGITAIASGVQVNNPQAIKFWQRHGYRIVSEPILHPDQTTAFDLRKDFHREVER
jgi:ribosomal protein S18 acetylase RimI-like enzyme